MKSLALLGGITIEKKYLIHGWAANTQTPSCGVFLQHLSGVRSASLTAVDFLADRCIMSLVKQKAKGRVSVSKVITREANRFATSIAASRVITLGIDTRPFTFCLTNDIIHRSARKSTSAMYPSSTEAAKSYCSKGIRETQVGYSQCASTASETWIICKTCAQTVTIASFPDTL